MDNFVDDAAILGDEEDEESFDEENGEPRSRRNGANGGIEDSSEEEEDDDEEAAAEVAAGFIVDEDEEDDDSRRQRRRDRKKRRREEREREDDLLDEEDLDLIGIPTRREDAEPKLKRLKRGPREDREERGTGLNDIFGASEDEDDLADRRQARLDRRGAQDEFDDFIEEDVFSDEEQQRQREDEEIARPRRRGIADLSLAEDAGLDEQAMEDFREAFGDGTEYNFALQAEDDAEYEELEREKQLNLKDVFEPSQLAEKLLTDEDNQIRNTDEPERHQLARKPYKHIELSEADFKEEAGWIANIIRIKKQGMAAELQEPFRRAVAQVLEFMVHDEYEVPFIFQNRKDHLIHAVRRQVGRNEDGTPRYEMDANKLLTQDDLWAIFESDLRFRAFVEKRQSINKIYEDVKTAGVERDTIYDEMLPQAQTLEELQDLQDYLYFQYASQIADVAATANGTANGTTAIRKKATATAIYADVRASKAYHIVRAFGITADAFAKNALGEGIKTYAEDSTETPDNLADECIDQEFPTGARALRAARSMFAEELATSPRLRKFLRRSIYIDAVVDCHRTDKGLRRITEDHPYYEFKYLRNQKLSDIARRPDMFLKMLKAEQEGLVDVKVRLREPDRLRKDLHRHIVTDAYSSVADAWNDERKNVVSTAFEKLLTIMSRNVKENLKNECEDSIALDCREEFSRKLDQAPYQPRGMKKGTIPRVLVLSLGGGTSGRDPVSWAYVSDDGRVLENGRFTELAPGNRERGLPDGKDVESFVEVVRRREPEIIGVSGWTPETRRLIANLEEIVKNHDLRGAPYPDDDDRERSDPLEVVTVNDEVARLYQTSVKAREQHPGMPQLTLYCIALAKYLQDPLKEYASLGKDIVSVTFVPAQTLLPQEKLLKAFETSLVDYVNMVGIDIDEAVVDPATANLLTYCAGLGPRKAQHLLKAYNMNSSELRTRESLLIGEHAPLSPKVWANAASTLYLRFEQADDQAEFLDNTRIHPEDYDIARKMAADALELDEEDIEAETKEFGPGAIVRRLIKEDAQDRVNDLVLDEYADQLEKGYNAKKRSTLENIRAELNDPYEEIRSPFMIKLDERDIFTMFTHETKESLQKGMNVPMHIKRVTEASVEGKLDCGIDAFAMEGETTEPGVNPKSAYAPHQVVQAHILSIDRKGFMAIVSLREEKTKRPFRRVDTNDYGHDQWDDRQEANDRKMLEQKTDAAGRVVRVVKHPLFKQMGAKQAEEYLGSMNRGDIVIRPSSKGQDHLAVTWKVADGVFQHIDVLELDKENEFTLGKTLRVGGKYNYSDLDELIVLHVKAMAKKVEEMMNNEKFQDKSKAALGKLTLPSAHRL